MPEQEYKDNLRDTGDWKPRPDPTTLTTQQLDREVLSLKELLDIRFDGIGKAYESTNHRIDKIPAKISEDVAHANTLQEAKLASILAGRDSLINMFDVRLSAMDKAQELFEENLNRAPTDIQKAVGTLRALHDARFVEIFTIIKALNTLIDEKFLLRDKGVKETADLTSTALQAALAAAEKSAARSNESFAASAAKTEASFTKTQDAQAASVNAISGALTDKLNDLKDRITASEGRSGGYSSMWGWIAGAIGLFIAFLGVAVSLAIYLGSHVTANAVAPIVIPK